MAAADSPAPIKLVIVDDEALARSRLKRLVADAAGAGRKPLADVVGEAGTVRELLHWLERHADEPGCDALLLDIQMPGQTGLMLAEVLRERAAASRPVPAIVFVTAHADHALRAFELDAVDYLTKPVKLERLLQALERVARRRVAMAGALAGMASGAASPGSATTAAPLPASINDDVIIVHDRQRILRIPVVEALYLKAELKYVTLRTATHSWLLDESLAELEPRLGTRFVRIHRNALVAVAAVRALERHALAPDGEPADEGGETWAVHVAAVDEWLAVSRRQLTAVKDALRAVLVEPRARG
jgi:two-component system, LytTR family, response regulator AlgR